MKRTRSKKSRGLETWRLVYVNRHHPHAPAQEIKVDVRRGETIDADYAAAMVAVRTSISLADVRILRIVAPDGAPQ